MPDGPRPSAAVGAWFDHELASRALRALLELLEPDGIPVLPVKGVVLARTLYADVTERPMADVDVRVLPADRGRIARLLRAQGWPILHGSKQWGAFETEITRMLVELETSIGPPGVCAIGVEEMIGRATRTSAGLGFPHLEPELHDHALVLCVTVFKDKIHDTVPWALGDLVRIARQPGFDAARMAALAARARLRAAVWAVADWAATAGGSDAWADVRDRIARRPPRALYLRAYRSLARTPRASRVALPILARAASDDPAARARALLLGGAGALSWWWAHAIPG
jgi:hypothetical protein